MKLLHTLIDTVTCNLRIAHSALKTGVEKSQCNIKDYFYRAFQNPHDSPTRREDYKSPTGSITKLLKSL